MDESMLVACWLEWVAGGMGGRRPTIEYSLDGRLSVGLGLRRLEAGRTTTLRIAGYF